jgi:hypothetical protein
VVNGNPTHRLPTLGTFGGMTLVDTDYVNRATVDGVADAATVHSIDLLDQSSAVVY